MARRQEHFVYAAESELDFDPATYQQAAGLTTYYNRTKFHAALVTHEPGGPVLSIVSCLGDWPDGALTRRADPARRRGRCALRVEVDHAHQRFLSAGASGGRSGRRSTRRSSATRRAGASTARSRAPSWGCSRWI